MKKFRPKKSLTSLLHEALQLLHVSFILATCGKHNGYIQCRGPKRGFRDMGYFRKKSYNDKGHLRKNYRDTGYCKSYTGIFIVNLDDTIKRLQDI